MNELTPLIPRDQLVKGQRYRIGKIHPGSELEEYPEAVGAIVQFERLRRQGAATIPTAIYVYCMEPIGRWAVNQLQGWRIELSPLEPSTSYSPEQLAQWDEYDQAEESL